MADIDGSELELVVESVRVHVPTNRHVLLLKEVVGDRLLPVWIGQWEASAIALWLQGERPDRPLTHDLLAAVITQLGARAERVVITRLDHDTFYARLDLVLPDSRVELDARPSDAIALAVRMGIPVYAAKDVLDRAASTFSLDAADDEDEGDEAIEAAPPIERAPLPAPEREQTGEPIDASRLLIFRDFVNSIDDPERRGHS